MKKQLLIILIFLCFVGLKAQTSVYHPFPTDSAIWTNASGYWEFPPGWPGTTWPPPYVQYYPPIRYCMSSADTIIGAFTYSKIDYCGGLYRGGLRDDGIGKIYFIPKDSITELLIYDFTVSDGDTVTVYETVGNSPVFTETSYTIGSIDSVLINGSYRKKIWLYGGEYWIEGIGCTKGLFVEAWTNVSGWYVNLECMSVSDTTVYPTTSFGPCSLISGIAEIQESEDLVLYPNPTNGLLQIKTEWEIKSMEVLDVFGRRMLYSETDQTEINISNFKNGIYFVRLSDSKGNSITKKIIKQ